MPAYTNESKVTQKGKRKLRKLIEVLILFALVMVVFVLGGRALCKIALDQIAELTNTKITTKSVRFDINGSVHIRGLVIRPEHDSEQDQAILKGERVEDAILKADTVYARFGIAGLLRFKPRLKKITVKDFVFDAQHNLDQPGWNLAAMKIRPPKGGAGKIPLVRLEGGVLRHRGVPHNRRQDGAGAPLHRRFHPPAKE